MAKLLLTTAFLLISIQNTLNFMVGNSVDAFSYSNSIKLQLNASDVGNTITLLPSQDPAFFTNLTNGKSDGIGLEYITPGGGGAGFALPEATFFTLHPAQWNGIDFQGYEITSLSLTINSLVFNSPGSNPNGNGQWTDYSFDATLAVNGQAAPEPSSILFGIIAMGVFGWVSIKHRLSSSPTHPCRA